MNRVVRAATIVTVAGLLLGGCGDDGGADDAGRSTSTSEATTTTTAAATSTTTTTSTTTPETGGDDEWGATTTSSSTSTSTTAATADEATADEATADEATADEEDGAPEHTDPLEFFRSTEVACIEHTELVGNSPPEPERFEGARVVEMVAFRVWRIEDGLGDELLVDLEGGVVYSVDGPDQPVPIMYSFGCPPELYVGTLPH